ncbi:MAG TPA: dephospho-CoA kinase [Polyangiaceae bacterium]|jgi:dephospho-CoA kinase|nr:dephospho-CoA kinase [Polyangiaceae bacterium]
MQQTSAMRVFGLTGGIASGKSSVAAHWRRRGLPVLDADALAREVVAPGSEGLSAVLREFGGDLLEDGALNRKELGRRVFGDTDQLRRLESITHPRIEALRRERLRELEARGEPLACVEIPLLFEKNMEAALRPVVLVSVPEALQLERARHRDGAAPADLQARIAAQLPLSEKRARADHVIDNRGTLDELYARSDAVLARVCQLLGVPPARYGLPPEAAAGPTS